MSEWKEYHMIPKYYELRPYVPGEDLDPGIDMKYLDKVQDGPKEGDMIARHPNNHDARVYVPEKIFNSVFMDTPISEGNEYESLLTTLSDEVREHAELSSELKDALKSLNDVTAVLDFMDLRGFILYGPNGDIVREKVREIISDARDILGN